MSTLAAEFVDYKRAPGFWFYYGMSIAADISENPFLSAKFNTEFGFFESFKDKNLFELFEKGIRSYEYLRRRGIY